MTLNVVHLNFRHPSCLILSYTLAALQSTLLKISLTFHAALNMYLSIYNKIFHSQ